MKAHSRKSSEDYLLPCWMEKRCWWPTAFYESIPYLFILHGILILVFFAPPVDIILGATLCGAGVVALSVRIRQQCGQTARQGSKYTDV
ncbi:MAG: hypothetical protein C0631_18150 [Sedimenticola sp.]|jgi:hypothetical protein|nr:MAG: hypothetical protein C0631_18150 [Sedimenticola sp.]